MRAMPANVHRFTSESRAISFLSNGVALDTWFRLMEVIPSRDDTIMCVNRYDEDPDVVYVSVIDVDNPLADRLAELWPDIKWENRERPGYAPGTRFLWGQSSLMTKPRK